MSAGKVANMSLMTEEASILMNPVSFQFRLIFLKSWESQLQGLLILHQYRRKTCSILNSTLIATFWSRKTLRVTQKGIISLHRSGPLSGIHRRSNLYCVTVSLLALYGFRRSCESQFRPWKTLSQNIWTKPHNVTILNILCTHLMTLSSGTWKNSFNRWTMTRLICPMLRPFSLSFITMKAVWTTQRPEVTNVSPFKSCRMGNSLGSILASKTIICRDASVQPSAVLIPL
jgi:hypothetical protein